MAEQPKPIGGLRRVWLIPADGVREVAFADGGVASLLLGEGVFAIELPLLEEQSRYEEELTLRGGVPSVKHTLELSIDRFEGDPLEVWRLERELLSGVVARVETLAGEQLLVGWSQRVGLEAPLRLYSLTEERGRRRKDPPTLRLLLASYDGWPALPISITENLKINEKT